MEIVELFSMAKVELLSMTKSRAVFNDKAE